MMELDRRELHNALDKYFNEEELRTLCFELGVDYADLPGIGQSAKARELITYAERHSGITELIERIVELRPNAYWRDKLMKAGAYTHNSTQEIPLQAIRAASGRTGPLRDENRLLFSLALARINTRLDEIDAVIMKLVLGHRTLAIFVLVSMLLVGIMIVGAVFLIR